MYKRHFLLILLCLAFTKCNEENLLTGPEYNLESSIILVDSLNPDSLKKDYLKVLEKSIMGDFLKLKVQYYGGCKLHEIKIYTIKSILKTNPPQFELFISHNSKNDSCEAIISKEYLINLIELKEFYKKAYGTGNLVRLRVYEPNSNSPLEPLLEYYL